MPETSPLILVDGSTYLFRAYYALPDLKNATGLYTGAIRGVTSMLLKLMDDFPKSPIVVVFDTAAKTFRHELYSEYKATRPPMKDEMAQQIVPLHQVVEAMGLPLLKKDGFEADDIIGTLATLATEAGIETIVSTSDKDMAQLVNDHVSLLDTMRDTKLNREGVKEKFGVPPELIIDYLALMGDTSDNIPGVPKVGPKTAAKWLNQYGSLDAVLENMQAIKGRVGENLVASAEILPLSRELATIKCDVDLEWSMEDLKRQPMRGQELTELFKQFEFRTLLRQLNERLGSDAKTEQRAQFELITDPITLQSWMDRALESNLLSLGLRQTSNEAGEMKSLGFGICTCPERAAYVPILHSDSDFRQLKLEQVVSILKPVLENAAVASIGSDLKTMINFFYVHGVQVSGPMFDTRLMSYVLNSAASGGHWTSTLAFRYLDHTTIDAQDLIGSGAKRITWKEVPIPETGMYMAELAHVNFEVYSLLLTQLEKDPRTLYIYKDIEIPVSKILAKVERNGVHLEPTALQSLSAELDQSIQKTVESAHQVAGEPFGLGSTKQLATILYDKLGLTAPRKTRSGARSTSEIVLRELAEFHPLPKLILDYRSATKLKSTYTDQLWHYIHPRTGRVHTTYDQANAVTGRLSSVNPNLQNIPNRTEQGRRIRRAFTAPTGYKLVSADYSQIELRIMAHLSKDSSLQQAFREGLDIHRATAADVFETDYSDVGEQERRIAKTINFGLNYGMSPFGLAQRLSIEQSVAKDFIEKYFDHYPGVRDYMESTKAMAHEAKYVETLFGRRVYLDDIDSSDFQRRQGAERLAINAPMQGSAADIIKLATVAADGFLSESRLDAKMVLHIHDEIMFEVAEEAINDLSSGVVDVMQSAAELDVPLVVDVGVGDNWSDAH